MANRLTSNTGADPSLGAERAEHLVGGDVVKPESILVDALQPTPVLERRLQQREGADDVGAHERRRAVDRTVDVALGGEMDDDVRREASDQLADFRAVDDVRLREAEAWILCHRRQASRLPA